jgi:DNA-binding XRE family transcriptional regulator
MAVSKPKTLVQQARSTLGWTQRDLAEAIGISVRTAARYESGSSSLDFITGPKLAAHVYPVDRDLAAEIVALHGKTLVSAGIEAPAPPPPPPAAPDPAPVVAPTPPSRAVLQTLIDAIVCAVADSSNAPPRAVRPAVLQTLRKVIEVGLDVHAAGSLGLLLPEEPDGAHDQGH